MDNMDLIIKLIDEHKHDSLAKHAETNVRLAKIEQKIDSILAIKNKFEGIKYLVNIIIMAVFGIVIAIIERGTK